MSGFRWAQLALLTIAFVSLTGVSSSALFWFQTGVRGGSTTYFNNGASVAIQTIEPQYNTNASLGFWVGEDLSNGAFLQVGYEVANETATYPDNCTVNGCTGQVDLTAGNATWFWEYFPADYNGQNFYGMFGPNGSAGKNGTFNTYSFASQGDVWTFYMNGMPLGSVNLGASNSGSDPAIAFGEDAGDTTNSTHIRPVPFRNFQFMSNGRLLPVPIGYAYTGYGAISEMFLKNPYGVTEVYPYVNYFLMGSGISSPVNDTVLWNIGYNLKISSQYANLGGSGNYSELSRIPIAAPKYVNVSNGVREVFAGWKGNGLGSYTGPLNQTMVKMYGNITETALWTTQYYINATTDYASVNGGGWVNANSTENLSVSAPVLNLGYYTRAIFSGWSDGQSVNTIKVKATSPLTISALWGRQYYLNATSEYGDATGSGWYDANSTATVSVESPEIQLNSTTRAVFSSWNGNYTNQTLAIAVTKPMTLAAEYSNEYLTTFDAINAYNQTISPTYFYVDGQRTGSEVYLLQNVTHNVEYLDYKGVNVTTDFDFVVNYPQTVYVKAPIYDVEIRTADMFGRPVNASLAVTFRNGTRLEAFSGVNGTVNFVDVPYGYVNGSAVYFGISENILASNGGSDYLTFLNTGLIVAVIIGVLIVALSAIYARHIWRVRR